MRLSLCAMRIFTPTFILPRPRDRLGMEDTLISHKGVSLNRPSRYAGAAVRIPRARLYASRQSGEHAGQEAILKIVHSAPGPFVR